MGADDRVTIGMGGGCKTGVSDETTDDSLGNM
jgi:hypothetical protein